MKRKSKMFMSLLLGSALVLSACGSNESSGSSSSDSGEGAWSPSKPIEMIAPAGAGGGWDTTARTISKVMEKENIIDERMAVANKPGGGGAVGWSYVDKKGSDHTLFVTSPPILFVPLNGQSDLGHNDFTPIAGVIADYSAFVVPANSPYDTMSDLVDALNEDPSSVSVVGDSSPGSMDHMAFVKAVKAAGVDIKQLKYVSAQDGSGMSMLLGNKVDVYSTGLAEATEQARAGKVKVLAITSPEPLEGETVSDFPTLKEQGIDDEFIVWRGIMGPKDMSPEAAAFYEQSIKDMMETDEWKTQRDNFGWNDNFMTGEEFQKFLDEEKETMETLLEEVGLAK